MFNNTSTFHHDLNSPSTNQSFKFSMSTSALLVVTVLLALVTVLGNALVVIAFVVDKNLRHRSNYFFLSLAISDFLVGAICIPLYIPETLMKSWLLGRGVCKFWLVIDYLSCTASAFNIVLISYDRYQSVYNAVSYRNQQGAAARAVIQVATVWILAFVVHGPAIMFWDHVTTVGPIVNGTCKPEFSSNWHFLMCVSILDFAVPTLSVAYFNMQIYRSICKRSRRIPAEDPDPLPASSPPCLGLPVRLAHFLRSIPLVLGQQRLTLHLASKGQDEGLHHSPETHSRSFGAPSLATARCDTRSQCKLLRDRKMARSLSIILVAFAICWAPYSLLTIIRAARKKHELRDSWYEFVFWLQWVNSSLNPFLYPLCHRKFRKAFLKVLSYRQQVNSVTPSPVTSS
ncbi:histamine H3 receptor-like [Ornithorhynchus anatinus]|uniref:G-protein coupled receptors family 1 profile domain-containing protein n=1 Tax=Ornithorhynchus anatinus TaxID=9258 RepID=A0A6I8PPR9_ORNAN|nr:histamine H3 receptor-like [Ornithorhynchus anatinus]